MDNYKFSMIEYDKLEELLIKVNKVYDLLQAERIQPDKLYSNEEACEYLKVCSKTLQNYRDNGQIQFIQTGRKIYYKQSQMNEFLFANKKDIFKKKLINFK